MTLEIPMETVQEPIVDAPWIEPLIAMPDAKIPSRHSELQALFSPREQSLLAQFKRVLELYDGDKHLRAAFEANELSEEQQEFLRSVGVHIPWSELSKMWSDPEVGREIGGLLRGTHTFDELSDATRATMQSSELLSLYARFNFFKAKMVEVGHERSHSMQTPQPSFNAWRRRRIAACNSELGRFGEQIDHPVIAIELNVGCSVGCYFCAFDAKRLTQTFDYDNPEHLAMFRATASHLTDLFGPYAGSCLLYWSTEPHDNPHYIEFLKEYEAITGSVLCTSTARWNEDWIRGLIDFYRPTGSPWPRISVLSRKIMHRLFDQFTPEEFRDVWVLAQQKDNDDLRTKVPGGRDKMLKNLKTFKDRRDYAEDQPLEEPVVQGSISCVSGFLINLLEGTVHLISPCFTSEKYPYGYRTFAQASFENDEELNAAMRHMIERHMPEQPYDAMPMAFRDDLDYRPKDDGFTLVSPHHIHRFHGSPVLKPLGELIQRGDLTCGEVNQRLFEDHGLNPMLSLAMIKNLFDQGFLDEVGVEIP